MVFHKIAIVPEWFAYPLFFATKLSWKSWLKINLQITWLSLSLPYTIIMKFDTEMRHRNDMA